MNKTGSLPRWRKVLILTNLIIILLCIIIFPFFEESKEYDYQEVVKWVVAPRIWIIRIMLFCGIVTYFLSLHEFETKNHQAKWLLFFSIICLVTSCIISLCIISYAIDEHFDNEDFISYIGLIFAPSILINSLLATYISKKLNEQYNSFFIIPNWMTNIFKLDTIFKKRIVIVLLLYPIFLFVPIPIGGTFATVFYILPITLILGFIWIIAWLKEGKKLSSHNSLSNNTEREKAKLYCRHCGKLIDADSKFCRYCGRELL